MRAEIRQRGMKVVVGRMSPFVPFDVPALLRALNEAKGATKDHWGGSNLVGGSPRIRGSRLAPDEVERIINRGLRRSAAMLESRVAQPRRLRAERSHQRT